MNKTYTCGAPTHATEFEYDGTVENGITIYFKKTSSVPITANFLRAIRKNFAGQEIPGGFSMDNPPPDGLGIWVRDNSANLNGRQLTPRHASFIAAILRDVGWVTCCLKGNAVYLKFLPA